MNPADCPTPALQLAEDRCLDTAGEQQLAAELLDALAIPAWLHTPGQALRANAALMRLSGLTSALLPAADAHGAMVVESDRAALAEATQECLNGSGEPPAQCLQLLTRNGTCRPVELTLRKVHHAGRASVLVTCVDLSDFQHVQNMLLNTGMLLRQIVEGAPVAVYVIDQEHQVTHWNSACERLTGLAAHEVMGGTEHWRICCDVPCQQLADLVVDGLDPLCAHPPLRGKVSASDQVPGAFEHEIWHEPAGAEGRWLHFTVGALRDASGQRNGAIVTLQDVTPQRRTQGELTRRIEAMVNERSAELAAHARLMDAFIDNAPIGVAYTIDDEVQRANRQMVEILGPGVEANGTGGVSPYFMDEQDTLNLRQMATPLFANNHALHQEMWLRDHTGRPLWLQVNACPVDSTDPSRGAWWMLQDRTEVRSAQEALQQRLAELAATNQQLEAAQNQLLQQEKMASIGQLAAGVAHEINNPVGFVSSNLHTLRQYVQSLLTLVDVQSRAAADPHNAALQAERISAEKATQLDYLKEDLPLLLDESADGLSRVKKIVQDLKDFSRVDHSDWQRADLNAGLESTLNVVRNEVRYKCEVVKQLGNLPLVNCLAGRLNQVFMNLIVNASHAIATQGTITLSTGSEGDWAWVQVADNGCGMSEDVQRRIFEPFYTTKAVGKGTGLGLSLSFSIVQKHGGQIQVRSAPGQGSVFRVWVPVNGPVDAPGGAEAGAPPAWE